jgi:hypothetical protein
MQNMKKGARMVHVAWLKQQLVDLLQGNGYDMTYFENPELASPAPLDMDRPWKM